MSSNRGHSYANRFRNSRRQNRSKRRSGSAKRSGLLARTTFQTSVREELFLRAIRARLSHRLQFIPQVSREEIRRSRRFRCARLREGETRFSIAMGHGASRSKRRLGKNGRRHQSARSRPRCARVDLSSRGVFPPQRCRNGCRYRFSVSDIRDPQSARATFCPRACS